jgi:hypothetical protein
MSKQPKRFFLDADRITTIMVTISFIPNCKQEVTIKFQTYNIKILRTCVVIIIIIYEILQRSTVQKSYTTLVEDLLYLQ